ncbi:translation initiation factor IF-2 [Parahypoxylon ruwenzoriense]
MLRARVSKRDTTSVCAFCQHRLLLRPVPPRKRCFSSTNNLENDEAASPKHGSLSAGRGPHGPVANGGWGSWGGAARSPAASNAQGHEKQGVLLSPHEMLAREKLIAKQRAQKPPVPPEPPKQLRPVNNGLNARHVWDAGKQRAIEASLRRDAVSLPGRGDLYSRESNLGTLSPSMPPSSLSPSRLPTHQRPFPGPGPNPARLTESKPWDNQPKPEPHQADRNRNRIPPDAPRNRLATTPNRQDVASGNIPGLAGQFASLSLSQNLTTSKSNVTPETSPSKAPASDLNAWGSMARKPSTILPGSNGPSNTPPARNPSDEFKRASNTTSGITNRGSGLSDSAVYPTRDNGLSSSLSGRELKPRAPFDNTIYPRGSFVGDLDWGLLARKQAPQKAESEAFWVTMANSTNTKSRVREQLNTDDSRPTTERELDNQQTSESREPPHWGREFDKKEEEDQTGKRSNVEDNQSAPEEGPSKQAQASSEAADGTPEELRPQDPKGTDRGRGRDKGADLFEPEERDRGGRKNRSRRNSRFGEDEEDEFDYDEYQEKRRLRAQRKAQREAEKAALKTIVLPELIGIEALADALKVERNLFLTQLGEFGFEGVTLDSLMTGETAALVVQEYGFEPITGVGAERDLKPRPPPEDPSILPQRPPIVTIMGHVDHGKTTLLDYLRKSSIAAQEHGGITQRIGAFSVKLSSGKPITFLDTPGHAAFLTMRQRGAYVTDIVVLVVAADDSVKPQTIEAIKHAQAAKVPIIVAINKIDKDGARIDQVKSDLAREHVEIEDFGGDVQVVCVSGKTGQGMSDLEENILTLSEILDHRAEVDGPAEGWVLESSLKPIGKAATVLVKRGTLRPGDYVAAGLTWAKIRHLRNEAGVDIDEAPPGTPVEILGWKDIPAAGDEVIQAPDEGRAKDAVEYREGLHDQQKDAAAHEAISESRRALQEKRAREKAAAEAGEDAAEAELHTNEENDTKLVNFVVKGDLHGSVEAVCAAVLELGNHEVRPRVLRSATGPISEFDVEHAATSKSVIINFATTTPAYVQRLAEEQGVKILDHTVIYRLVDDVKANLNQYLAPEISNRALGEAEVLQVFPINIRGRVYKNVAGCRVRNGALARGNLFRVFRGGEKLFDGPVETLKHLKKDVMDVRKGSECGIGFEDFQDFQVGDQIQAYEEIRTPRSL